VSFFSKLYVGSVSHRRFKPAKHYLRYRMYWLLLDLDEIDRLSATLRWFSRNRFNLFSFFDRDHGAGDGRPVRAYVEDTLRRGGLDTRGVSISLLCMPRILSYGFNPLSVFFCHNRDGTLMAILYEVHNTFRQRHAYLVAVDETQDPPARHSADKQFYVSPFMDMEMRYDFSVRLEGDCVTVAIKGSDSSGPLISAALTGRRRVLTDRALLGLFFTHPLLTFKVIAAIHWNALLLLLKGVRLHDRPAPPQTPVSIITNVRTQS